MFMIQLFLLYVNTQRNIIIMPQFKKNWETGTRWENTLKQNPPVLEKIQPRGDFAMPQ